MEKLYYIDQHIKEFIGEVEDVKEVNGQFHVVLDKSAFFPGGGGQHCDLGTIDNNAVIDVYEENGVVYHVMEKKPMRIHRVKCEIDWERRLDGMQQHLAQHVLSGCFFSLFNANTVSVHVGKEISTVDIQGYLDEDTIRKAEAKANEIIKENIMVEFLTPNKAQLKKLGLRRDLPKTNEEIRVVKIGDLDINACCGVHPKSTLEIQAIKIRKWEKHKDATIIEYLAGSRAIKDYFYKDDFTRTICKYLKCGEIDAINAISKLSNELKEAYDSNKKMSLELGEYKIKEMAEEAENFKGITIVKKVFDKENVKEVSKIADKLVLDHRAITLFAVKAEDRVNLIFSASKEIDAISMSDLLKDAITLIDGKGGGSKFLAQGGGKNSASLEMAMDYAERKLKESL